MCLFNEWFEFFVLLFVGTLSILIYEFPRHQLDMFNSLVFLLAVALSLYDWFGGFHFGFVLLLVSADGKFALISSSIFVLVKPNHDLAVTTDQDGKVNRVFQYPPTLPLKLDLTPHPSLAFPIVLLLDQQVPPPPLPSQIKLSWVVWVAN